MNDQKKKKKKQRKPSDIMMSEQKITPGIIVIYVVLAAWAILTVFPFMWVITSSFKTGSAVTETPFRLPIGSYISPTYEKSLEDEYENNVKNGMDANDAKIIKNQSIKDGTRDIFVGLDNFPHSDAREKSLKSEGAITNKGNPSYNPDKESYNPKFTLGNFGTGYKNSLTISIVVTIVVMLLAGMASYGLARYNFKGHQFAESFVIASMMFPVFSTIIPVFQMEFSWGLAGTDKAEWQNVLAVILPQIAGNLAFSITVLMGFIKSIPVDMEEAAYIEGYNIYRIFFQIIFPLARPAFATVAIFTFLWSYNDLFTQRFFLKADRYTVTRFLAEISAQGMKPNYGQVAAAVVLIVIPVLIAYIFLQKNIVKGLTAGAVKG
ncbi:MAG: carbohydrate ABC transporter permease [Oscillospiraceae bacterium]|jgi:raffinose/stachyose/melibiose transport system permease protein|nr:carbohydrate ABC transporter permease [Oscillospiraceae bacterium]